MVATSNPMPLAAVGDVARIDVRGYGSATLTLKGGTVNATGVSVVLEATNVDNPTAADFFVVQAAASGSAIGASTTPMSNSSLNVGQTRPDAWRLNVAGYTFVQARLTARTAGDIVAQWSRDTIPVEPVPAQQQTFSALTANPPIPSRFTALTTASTNRTAVVAIATSLDSLAISNPTATPAFLRLYDKATAPVAADTGAGVLIATIPIPANSFQTYSFPNSGLRFSSGLGLAVTAAAADNDDTATVAGIRIVGSRR